MTDSLTGNLLVASSLATDPIYCRGVCLVVHQDESNIIGVMLNRPLKPGPEVLLEMLNGEVSHQDCSNRLSRYDESANEETVTGDSSPFGMLHFGGPRSGPVVAIHQTSQYAEAETGDGIYVAAQKQHLEDLVRDHPAPYRLIVGHLGWEVSELEAELEAGIWHIVPATTDKVFAAADEMWPRLIGRATANSMADWIGICDVVNAGELN